MISRLATHGISYLLLALLIISVAGCGGTGADTATAARGVTVKCIDTGAPADAAWIAFQDGDTPWQVLNSAKTGEYFAPIADVRGRFGVAIARPNSSGVYMQLIYGTQDEVTGVTVTNNSAAYAVYYDITGKLSGTTDALPLAEIDVGPTGRLFDRRQQVDPWDFKFTVSSGTYDIACLRQDTTGLPTDICLARDLPIYANLTDRDYRLDGPQSYPFTDYATVTVDGPAVSYLGVMLRTRHNSWLRMGQASADAQNNCKYAYLPAALRDPGDLYEINAQAHEGDFSRVCQVYNSTPLNRIVHLPASMPAPTYDVTGLIPYIRPKINWAEYPAATYYSADFYGNGSAANSYLNWDVMTTPGWAKSAGNSFSIPDFSSMPGWLPEWGLTKINSWLFTATACNKSIGEVGKIFANIDQPAGDTVYNMVSYSHSLIGRTTSLPGGSRITPHLPAGISFHR
ncbi:MAG: hypothetical protein WCJ56_02900 [bacterium]